MPRQVLRSPRHRRRSDYTRYYPATMNSAAEAALALEAAAAAGLQASVAPRPAFTSEDFAFLLRERPGAYLWLGQGRAAPGDGRRTPAAPSLLRLQRRRTALRRALVLRRRRTCAGALLPLPTTTMSITVLHQTATLTGLQEQGTPAQPKSAPPCRLSGIDVELEGAGDNGCGMWECTPGRFERQLAQAEVMHIVCGRGAFTPTSGEPIEFRTGDTLFFPASTIGEWRIGETLRKVFVVMAVHS